jgi:hypothetical protein
MPAEIGKRKYYHKLIEMKGTLLWTYFMHGDQLYLNIDIRNEFVKSAESKN